MSTVLLNLSGHGLSEAALAELSLRFSQIETVPFDTIDFGRPVEPQIRRVLEPVKTVLDGSVGVTLILPGQATIAVLLFVYFHGLLGHYPALCLLQPDNAGIYRPASIFHVDSDALRLNARTFRQEILRKSLAGDRPK